MRLLLLAAVLLAAPRFGAAEEAERARNSACTGVYTGSARGVFWCRVVAVHDPKTNRATFRVETEGDIQLNGDALGVVPGTFEWTGKPAVGLMSSGDAAVATAWSTLQTGQPPNQVDYGASRAAAKVAPDQGKLTLELARVEPGPQAGELQTFLVHGSYSAQLLPLPGSKGIGEVRIFVTF
jgi:hypothetical protein